MWTLGDSSSALPALLRGPLVQTPRWREDWKLKSQLCSHLSPQPGAEQKQVPGVYLWLDSLPLPPKSFTPHWGGLTPADATVHRAGRRGERKIGGNKVNDPERPETDRGTARAPQVRHSGNQRVCLGLTSGPFQGDTKDEASTCKPCYHGNRRRKPRETPPNQHSLFQTI